MEQYNVFCEPHATKFIESNSWVQGLRSITKNNNSRRDLVRPDVRVRISDVLQFQYITAIIGI